MNKILKIAGLSITSLLIAAIASSVFISTYISLQEIEIRKVEYMWIKTQIKTHKIQRERLENIEKMLEKHILMGTTPN